MLHDEAPQTVVVGCSIHITLTDGDFAQIRPNQLFFPLHIQSATFTFLQLASQIRTRGEVGKCRQEGKVRKGMQDVELWSVLQDIGVENPSNQLYM